MFQPNPGEPSLPFQAVRSLFVSKAGELWVSGMSAAVAQISKGHVAAYTGAGGDASADLSYLQEDSHGNLWAVENSRYLVRLGKDAHWHYAEAPLAQPARIFFQYIDSKDTQWVVEENRLYRRPAGETHFEATTVETAGTLRMTEGPDHSLWLSGRALRVDQGEVHHRGELQNVDAAGRLLHSFLIPDHMNALAFAPDGSLWFTWEDGGGILRVRPKQLTPASPKSSFDTYRVRDGLSSTEEKAVVRDSDGNMWVGGLKGLDRFKPATLVPVPGGAQAVCTNTQGEVWLVTAAGGLSVLKQGSMTELLKSGTGGKVFCANDGAVFFMDHTGISRLQGNRLHRLPILANYKFYWNDYNFRAVLETADRELIASVAGIGPSGLSLWKLTNTGWEAFKSGLIPHAVSAMAVDDRGVLYLGHRDGKVSALQNDTVRTVTSGSPGLGMVVTFYQNAENLFAAGANGIAVYRGDHFEMLSFQEPELAHTVTGVVQARNGDLWMNGSRGIVRIRSAEVRAALSDSRHKMAGIQVKEGDLIGPASFSDSRCSATIDASGTLWFITLNGVVSVNPEKLDRQTSRPPHIEIRSIRWDRHPLNKDSALPASVRTLNIKYFGLNLTNPENVIYRYRLEGFEDSWQEVGHRTEAVYTRLRPGAYTFQVMASNGDGAWTEMVSSAPFSIMPSFYQTWWFAALCLVLAGYLLWLGLTMRVKYVANAIRMRAEERADERIRIARELHDTLLQGVQGLLLTFHVAAEKIPTEYQTKEMLDRALKTADQIIIEGRNRVSNLRSEHLSDAELLGSLERLGADLKNGQAVRYLAGRTGIDATLQPNVVHEIFSIGREALTNAFRHSGASEINLELEYRKRSFRLLCRDNGRGVGPSFTDAGIPHGHWGIRGMAERAEKIGGQFDLRSSAEAGTDVLVIVPAYRAYVRTSGLRALWSRFRPEKGVPEA